MRQSNKNRRPAGGRASRTVPVSRAPAEVRGAGEIRAVPRPRTGVPASYVEPEIRRWPHPVEEPPVPPEPALHYIRCALAYQNQLLADIKALLEERGRGTPSEAEAETPGEG